LFDKLVNEALRSRADLASLRPVAEKELLHHDILREMSAAGLLAGLTFIGGTCLRACFGSPRLSEDLDFTGGSEFQRGDLAELGSVLTDRLKTRYDLPVRVSEPVKTGGNVSTWKLVIETRPGQKLLPAQRIHLDISAIPSHDPHPMMLRTLYGVDLGTSGLILQAQSREEILADKIVAVASSKSGASLNLYNISKTTGKAPSLVHYTPLDLAAASLPISAPLLVPFRPPPPSLSPRAVLCSIQRDARV